MVVGFACAVASLGGCASIVSDSAYPVKMESSPAGAHFEVRNEAGQLVQSGTAPSVVTLKSGAGYFDGEKYTIKFTKEGFDDQLITLDSGVDGWYWGNILLGGVIGMLIVDPLTGAMYKLPPTASGNLTPVTSDASGSSKDLSFMVIDQVPESERHKLTRIN